MFEELSFRSSHSWSQSFLISDHLQMDLSSKSGSFLTSSFQNEGACAFRFSCFVALSRLSPGSNRMTSTGCLSFPAAERMIDRVHSNAAHMRPATQPSG